MIWSYLREHPVGRVFTAPFDVILSNFDVVEPDLLFLTNERLAKSLTSPWVKARRAWSSRSVRRDRKRDATIKRRLYERFGVDEYWILDPELDAIDVYRHVEGRYRARRSTLARGRRRADDAPASRPQVSPVNHFRGLTLCDVS